MHVIINIYKPLKPTGMQALWGSGYKQQEVRKLNAMFIVKRARF